MVWLELVTGKLCTVRGGLYLPDCHPSLLLSPLDPGSLGLGRRGRAIIIFLPAMVMRRHVARRSGKSGLKLPLVPIGSLEDFGDLNYLRHHKYPESALTVTVVEVKLRDTQRRESNTAIPGSNDDSQHEAAVGVAGAGRELVLAASPRPGGRDSLVAMEGPKGPVCHLEVGGVIGREMDDGNILDGDGICHALLIPEPACQPVGVVPTDEGHVE